MERVKVESSHLSEIGWADGVMEIKFKNGTVYEYHVPREMYEMLLESESKGQFFNNFIKPYGGVRQ